MTQHPAAKMPMTIAPSVRWLFMMIQTTLLLVFLLASSRYFSYHWVLSAFGGGMVCLVSSFLYLQCVLSITGAQRLRQICRRFYWGETLKIIVTLLLSLWVFHWQGLLALPYFLGFFVAHSVFFVAPWFLRGQ